MLSRQDACQEGPSSNEVSAEREIYLKVSFQSLDEIKAYIESRSPVTLQHPHHVTVVFSDAAFRAA